MNIRTYDDMYPDRECAWCFHPRNSARCNFGANHAPYYEYFAGAPTPVPIITTRVETVSEPREPEILCLDPGHGVLGNPDARPAKLEIVFYVTKTPDLSIPDNIILGDN